MDLLCFLVFITTYLLGSNFTYAQYYSTCTNKLDEYTCDSWSSSGMCEDYSYRYLMIENCQKTCNLCPAGTRSSDLSLTCADKRKSCFKWRPYCQPGSDYYDFMNTNCQRSCMFCEDDNCIDKKENCKKYEKLGYCDKDNMYHRFMRKNCELSCKFCLGVVDREEKAKKEITNYKKEYICDFERDECDWSNKVFEDTADWMIGSHEYGPVTGFNSSKKYLYLDAKYEGYYAYIRLPWELVLPDGLKDKGKMCFHFMYQMNHGAKLTVSQQGNPTLTNKFPATDIKFTSEDKATVWTHTRVNVYVSDGYEMLIKGVKGKEESYVGIDYVFFTEGEC